MDDFVKYLGSKSTEMFERGFEEKRGIVSMCIFSSRCMFPHNLEKDRNIINPGLGEIVSCSVMNILSLKYPKGNVE